MRDVGMSLRDWYYDLRYRFRQGVSFFIRGWSGVAPMDTWSFDRYLARVMAKGFRELAARHHGVPNWIVEQYGDVDTASRAWADWLIHKAGWLEWFAADEIPLTEAMSEREALAALAAYDKKYNEFKEEILPEIARRFDSLWD